MWHDIKQNSDEWLDLRAGKVTGSSIAKVMAHYGEIYKSGPKRGRQKGFGDPAKALAATIAVEQVTGNRAKSSGYKNSHMDRGHENEPIARMLYEEKYFVEVTNGGFYDNGNTGCSPDSNVLDDGLIEIKDAIIPIHYNRIRKGGFDSTYKWQYFFNLRESGREWLDFVSHCADFPEGNRLYVYRIFKKDILKELEMIDARLDEFFKLVESIKKDVKI